MTKVGKKAAVTSKAKKGTVKIPARDVITGITDPLQADESVEQARLRRAQEIINGFELPPKTKLFVIEYTKDMNGTQAAIRAGYVSVIT